jgi:hypothetical protein
MPAGKVHAEYHRKYQLLAIGVGIFAFCVGLLYNSYICVVAVWFVIWYWAGRYIDPDLDLQGITAAEGRMLRELDILGVFLVPITAFYAALIGYIIKKFKIKGAIGGSHRTWLTHSIVPGTLIRQAIICLVISFGVNLANEITQIAFGFVFTFSILDILAGMLGQFLGLGSADLIHILLDNSAED